MTAVAQKIRLANGKMIPAAIFGVYQVKAPAECQKAVEDALEAGYRAIDTAASYGNEAAVGAAIKACGLPREDLFITTKLWAEDASEAGAYRAVKRSLELLGLETLDLYLIHQPVGDVYGAWRTMEKLCLEGVLGAIGVSNFMPDRLVDFAYHQTIRPMVNQVEINPYCQQADALPVMRELIHKRGGLPIKPILAEGMQMGDENHTRQTAADYIFNTLILPDLFKMDLDKKTLMKVMDYIVQTPRFFHCYGQGASMSALLSAKGTPYSTMTVAFGGNGVEFGIKVAGMGDEWFTAPAMMMKGRYTSSQFSEKDQLPWIGDSCVVECAGLGGIAAAASPIVCSLRGLKLKDAIALTREMEQICISKNHNYPIPNLDFDFLPCGVDIRKVVKTGISPEIHGGMFNHEGGLIGAGSARINLQCFEKALKAFAQKYRD